MLANASASSEHLARRLQEHVAQLEESEDDPIEELKKYINDELVVPGLGITDATSEELTTLALYPESAQPAFANMISVRAQIGWSTHGHSAVDVNIYSSGGPGTEALRGNVENTDVGKFLREYLSVDVEAVTKELNDKMGSKPKSDLPSSPLLSEETIETIVFAQDHWSAHEAMEHRLVEEGLST